MDENPSLQQLIDRYNRQLMQYHQQSAPPERPAQAQPPRLVTPPTPTVPTPPARPEAPARPPVTPAPPRPDMPSRPPAAPAPVPPMPAPPSEPQPALVRARVYTARQAIPIEGARVWISSLEDDGSLMLRARVVTNADGLTRQVSVPADSLPGDALPGTPGAGSEYVIEVWADEYLPAQRRITLVGGAASEVPVEMLPSVGSAERSGAYA